MPIYSFINPDTGEEIELVQSMKEPHVYVDENGLEWKRVWSLPNAAIDAEIDPFDKQAFSRKIKVLACLGESFLQTCAQHMGIHWAAAIPAAKS